MGNKHIAPKKSPAPKKKTPRGGGLTRLGGYSRGTTSLKNMAARGADRRLNRLAILATKNQCVIPIREAKARLLADLTAAGKLAL